MIEYSWKVENLLAMPTLNNLQDVVVSVAFSLTATEDEFSATRGDTVNLTYSDGPFTEFVNLTEAQVLEWVKASIEAEKQRAIEMSLKRQINMLKNPPVTPQPKPLPWNP